MFKFNDSGKEDSKFTNMHPYFFSYQFEGSNSRKEPYHNDFYLMDNYGVKYHYEEDFANDGMDVLGGIYGNRIRTNRNVGIFHIQKILAESKKEFTNLKQSYQLGDFDLKQLASFKFRPNFGIAVYRSPPLGTNT